MKHGSQIRKRAFRLGLLRGTAPWTAACLAICWPTGVLPQIQSASEYEIKAAFLYNFAKFVEWPADGSWKEGDDLTICVVGEDPFGSTLDKTVRGKTIDGHRVTVRRMRLGGSWKGCKIAFVRPSQKQDIRSILERAASAAVLTVGENDGFAENGGMIKFFLAQGRVRFEVNRDAAERGGLKISSKLLSLAKIVGAQDARGGI